MKKLVCVILCVLSFIVSAVPVRAATKVFLLAGQSNMGGCGVSAELVGELAKYAEPQARVMRWDGTGNQWVVNSCTFGGGAWFGPEISFGCQMQAVFPNDKIYLVKYAIGGTSLAADWNPAGTNNAYAAFKSTALAAITNLADAKLAPEVAGMLWMQGEADAAEASFAPAYQTNLTNFISAVRRDFSTPDMPFVLGRIIQGYGTTENNTIVRTAQVTVPTLVAHTSWANTDDLQLSTNPALHFGTQGQIDLGLRFAGKITQTPEPSAMLLFLTGVVALLGYIWRKPR